MLKSLALVLSIIGLTFVVTVKCKKDPKDSRQAIPLALVQADTLASAKHPPNTDKANGTTNGTALANNSTNNNTILHKVINLYNPSVSANIPQAVWRVDHQLSSNYGAENEAIVGSDNSGMTNNDDPFEEFTRCNHSQEILVGPLKSLPEHPNGNGPQDMKLKATGINKRNIGSSKDENSSSKTIKRFKREFEIDDDDDDDDANEKAETIILRLKSDRNQHERSRRSKKSTKSKKSSKRDGIGLPYVPSQESFISPGASRLPYDEEAIMEDEMSRIPSSQPVGMASSPEPLNYGPYEDAPQTANEPAQEFESPAPDPLRLQESYERSSTWEPIGTQGRFSQQEEYNDGLPDRNYDRTLESDAQSLDDRMVQNFFNREKGRQGYDQSYDSNKRSEEDKYSLLDSLGIGESEIDHKYLSEAKSIQDYLTKSEIRSVGQSLGHDTRQHNNIQVGSSPEMLQERPNIWNMIDSASYTPLSNEAETLMPNEQRDNDGQVLQSQNSMGRVFVPLNMENLAQNVQNEISKHYTLPNRVRQNGMIDPDKAVPNYPNIVKSFYPNIPYQTVSGATLNPPDINSPNYRSFIQQPYTQQQQQPFPQQFMQTPQAPFQPVPVMLPFAGMPNPQYQNMLGTKQAFMSPMQMSAMGRGFPMGMPSAMPGNNQGADFPGHEARSFGEEAKPKGPGMLTVSSSDNGDDAAQQQSKASDFEELIPTATHNTIQKGNVENRPKNDTLMYRREKVEADLASMKTAIKEVLDSAVLAGNITSDQSKAITDELTGALVAKEKNKTTTATNLTSTAQEEAPNKRVIEELKTMKSKVAHVMEKCSDTINDCKRFKDAGICPFVATFMNGACAKTCNTCETKLPAKSRIQELLERKKDPLVDFKEKNGPSMYLDFENATSANIITDKSGHGNDAVLLKGAKLSSRKLGTCGKGAELNQGEISWDGKTFHGKPVDAVTLAMWVKVHKGGTINWFASGDQGTTFYTSTKDAIVPSKIWTHVTGTYDSVNGMSSIFINGALIKQTKQKKGQKLVQDWLVNGIGQSFGDDSMHYVDEVYIFNRALKAFEVKALYDKCSFNRMVIHYGFQKGNNSLILDQSGLQNDAIPIAGATQKDDCDRCGACLDLTHGLNPTLKIERISLSHIPTRAVSIALWVSMNSTKGVHDVFITQGPLDGSGYRLRIIDGKIRWSVGTDNGETIFDVETKSVTIPETLWTHIIVTYDKESGHISIFVNGVSKLDETVDQKQRKLLPRDWETEAKLGDKSFNGFMDEFIMYNWAIDSSEAMYVRKYCADHPKLVRFIVHVPLTKRNKVVKVEETKSIGTEIHKKDD